jgi:hypothetical protein
VKGGDGTHSRIASDTERVWSEKEGGVDQAYVGVFQEMDKDGLKENGLLLMTCDEHKDGMRRWLSE